MSKRMLVDFDALSYRCPYFTTETSDGRGYGCAHPENDELEEMLGTGELVGYCSKSGCPVCCGLDEEDLNNPDFDLDGCDRSEFFDLDGKFVDDDEFATICCDGNATADEKKLLYAYQRYMHRYDKEWLKNHKEEM